MTSPPPSPAMPKYKLAEYRYGREEMLALYVKDNKVCSWPTFYKTFHCSQQMTKDSTKKTFIFSRGSQGSRCEFLNPLEDSRAKISQCNVLLCM